MVKFPRVRILNTSYSKKTLLTKTRAFAFNNPISRIQPVLPWMIGKNKVDDWTIEKTASAFTSFSSRPSGGQITGVRRLHVQRIQRYVMADDWDKMDDLFSDASAEIAHQVNQHSAIVRRNLQRRFIFVQQRGRVDDSTGFLISGGMGLTIDLHIKNPRNDRSGRSSTHFPMASASAVFVIHAAHHKSTAIGLVLARQEDINDLMALKAASPHVQKPVYARP